MNEAIAKHNFTMKIIFLNGVFGYPENGRKRTNIYWTLLSAMSVLATSSSVSYFYLTQSSQQLHFTDENTKARAG